MAYISDHLSTNGVVYENLKKERETEGATTPFDWIRCVMHKFNLMEDHLLAELKKHRVNMNCVEVNEIASGENEDVILLEEEGV